MKAAADLDMPVKLRIRVSGFDAVSRMVQAGLGVALIPDSVAQNYMPTMAINAIKLDEEWAARQINVCVRDTAALTGAASLLLRHLTKK
jgi:DNA-binding transcriptional LysR family regulator